MFRLYAWALAEKTLTLLPYGEKIYSGIGALVSNSKGRVGHLVQSFSLVRKAKELMPPGGSALDIGTGWFHQDAFLLYLLGDYKVYLFDVKDKAKLVYIKRYLEYLRQNVQTIAAELNIDQNYVLSRITRLQSLTSKRAIYTSCNFTPCITRDTGRQFLPEGSIDLMFSFCVLNHIPVGTLLPELIALRRMLKNDGRMYHYIGHIDHWAFHDPSANEFNYYRYSDRYYRLVFENRFEFQNRLVKQEWFAIFEKCGFDVEEYTGVVTRRSRDQISKLSLDSRFAKHRLDELAAEGSYFLLRKKA